MLAWSRESEQGTAGSAASEITEAVEPGNLLLLETTTVGRQICPIKAKTSTMIKIKPSTPLGP
jgi:hypothetical protein